MLGTFHIIISFNLQTTSLRSLAFYKLYNVHHLLSNCLLSPAPFLTHSTPAPQLLQCSQNVPGILCLEAIFQLSFLPGMLFLHIASWQILGITQMRLYFSRFLITGPQCLQILLSVIFIKCILPISFISYSLPAPTSSFLLALTTF